MHGINNAWLRLLIACVVFAVLVSVNALAQEGGMIPMDSPAGEIGGRGHWYSLRTMKAETYYELPPVMSDIIYDEEGNPQVSGEPPIEMTLLLHRGWYTQEPWRYAIKWVREAEQMFRNSGVPVRFIIKRIVTVPDMPDTKREAYYYLRERDAKKYATDSDLVVALMPHYYGDPYCGIASIGGWLSVSGCSTKTLAHELGHNFGLHHAHQSGYAERKGYCISPSPSAEDCDIGTLMSYAGRGRLPLFADHRFTKDGNPLGEDAHTAVEWLNKVKTKKALRIELTNQSKPELSARPSHTEETLCR